MEGFEKNLLPTLQACRIQHTTRQHTNKEMYSQSGSTDMLLCSKNQ